MAVISLPDGCWRQPEESESMPGADAPEYVYVVKGSYASLASIARSLTPGAQVFLDSEDDVGSANAATWLAKSWKLQRGRGLSATLTVSCSPDIGGVGEGADAEAKALKETWTIHSVRNDVSAMRYCGPSIGANPQRDDIEMWLKETDRSLSEQYKYRTDNGEVRELSEPSQALAEKLRKGIESVMRFYTVLTRKRIYAEPPPDLLDKLSFVDTPPTPATTSAGVVKFPAKLTGKIALYQWLKCQDDVDETPDGKWTRTESWMGILKADDPSGPGKPWDEDLYGQNRWKFPADPAHEGSNYSSNNNSNNSNSNG